GVAVGLVSLVAPARGRWGAAVVGALLTPLASPVAGAFLALAALAWAAPTWRSWRDPLAVGDRRGRGPVLALAALGPIVVIAVLFPSGGTFPFALGGLLAGLATTVGLVLAVPPRHRAIRAGAAMATLALIAAFVLPTPMGANAARLPMFFALPIVVAIVAPRRPVVATIGGVLLVVWAWQPAMDAVLAAPADPSVDAAFHAPLVAALRVEGHGEARVEIVPTARHWEVVHVAPHVPLARGWERQLDRRYNPVFYGDDLDALSYRGWLEANAVRFVALPDAELDPSGEGEAELIELGLPYLRPVWDDEHWQLFEVIGGVDLVAGPAELVELTADRVVLRVTEPGVVTVRVRHGPHWTASGGACVAADDDGWIVVHAAAAGRVELTQGIDPAAPLTGSPGTCDPGP
ncbi:MAG TPA: hypothetical protein VK866_01895, partial [Acidimicrobiales bacterium]|nr:hypothetical protein [Acidimicrobiales bacterium]